MRRALRDLEICQQRAGVDRRRNLADAAALLRFTLAAVGVDDCCQIALFLRALADNFVERELIARVQNRTVNRLAGKLEVFRSCGVRSMRAVVGSQNVRKVRLFKLLQRHLGHEVLHLNRDDLARLGHGKLLRVIRKIEAVAVDLGHKLLLFLVVIRIRHFLAVLIIILLQIDALARHGIIVEIQVAEIARREAGNDCVIELVGVERHCRRPGGNRDRAGLFVDLYDGVNLVGCALARSLVDERADIVRVEIEARIEVDRIFALARAQIIDNCRDRPARAAIAHRFVNRLIGVERHLRDLRGQAQRPVGQHHIQCIARVALLHGLRHRGHCRVPLKPADIHTRNIDIRVNRVLIFEHEAIRANAKHNHHNQRQRNDEPLLSAAGRSLRRFGLLRGLTDLLFGHRRPLGRAALLKLSFLSDRNPSNLHRQSLPGIGNMSSQARKTDIMTTIIIPKHSSFCNGNSTKNAMQIMNLSLRFASARAAFPPCLHRRGSALICSAAGSTGRRAAAPASARPRRT